MTEMAETGRLRTLAIDHIRAGRWADLVALEPDLRADGQFWSSLWGPSCAIARWHCGRADARDLLEECIAAGFYEPDFETGFEESFGTEPDWPTLHARTEAWIDDLGRWALLDGQNGAVWRDADGVPLSVLEMQRRYERGDRPEFSGSGPNFDAANDPAAWFGYFHAVGVAGTLAWSAGPYLPILERTRVIESELLADTTADVAPDLAEIRTGVADREGPALVFTTDHPYATGFQVTDAERGTTTVPPGESFPLAREAGEYRATVAVATRYGALTPQPLHYRVR